MRSGFLLFGALLALVFGLACACGGEGCPEGERDDYGTCIPVECGDYPFGDFVNGDYVFVSAYTYSEDEDQNGSSEEPFDTLAEGIAVAMNRNPTVPIIVSAGTYDESLKFDDRHDGLRIEGVCGPQTFLQGTDQPTILLDGSSTETVVEIASVQVTNAQAAGVVVVGGTLVLTNVDVADAIGVGISAFGPDSALDITEGLVSGIVAQEDYEDGYGLAVAEGASAIVRGLDIAESGRAGVLVDGRGSSADVSGSLVRGGIATLDGWKPVGMVISNGASASFVDTSIVESWNVGLEISGASAVTADRVTVSGTVYDDTEDVVFGSGVVVIDGSVLDASDLTVEGSALYGIAADGVGTVVTVDGGFVRDSTPTAAEPSAGIGLVVSGGALLTATNLQLSSNHVYGAAVSDADSELDLVDVDVLDTEPTDLSTIGGGILAQEGGRLEATRVSVAGSGTIGILVDGSSATLTDVDVRDTHRGSYQSTAVGVAAQADSSFSAERLEVTATEGPGLLVSTSDATCARCTLSGNAFAGLLAADGAELTLTDAVITDTAPDATEGGGVGVFVQSAALPVGLTLTGAEISGNTHAAVYVNGDGAVLVASSTLVGGETARNVWPRGTGLYATGTTAQGLTLRDDVVSASAGAGLFFDDGTATLIGNRYPGNAIDVVQQLCGAATTPPVGLDEEPVDTVEICPAFDYPVERFTFLTVYEPLVLAE